MDYRIRRALNSVPLSEDFKTRLEPLTPHGIFEHPLGIIVKVGHAMEKIAIRSSGKRFIRDYRFTFRPSRYGSRKTAIEAAALYAFFYRDLAKKRIMHPQTRVIVHLTPNGSPTLTIVQKKLREFGTQLPDGVFKTRQTDAEERKVDEIAQRMFEKIPGLRDIVEEGEYIYPGSYGTEGKGRSQKVYLFDLHVMDKPHHKKTLAWLKKQYGHLL